MRLSIAVIETTERCGSVGNNRLDPCQDQGYERRGRRAWTLGGSLRQERSPEAKRIEFFTMNSSYCYMLPALLGFTRTQATCHRHHVEVRLLRLGIYRRTDKGAREETYMILKSKGIPTGSIGMAKRPSALLERRAKSSDPATPSRRAAHDKRGFQRHQMQGPAHEVSVGHPWISVPETTIRMMVVNRRKTEATEEFVGGRKVPGCA